MSSAAVVTGALRVKRAQNGNKQNLANRANTMMIIIVLGINILQGMYVLISYIYKVF